MAGEFRKVADEIRADLIGMRNRMRKDFTDQAYSLHRDIIQRFYTGSRTVPNEGVKRRTGKAAKSWQVKRIDSGKDLSISVFSAGVAYADFSKPKEIKPKSGKYLVIPIGAGLTSSGAPRYPGDASGKGSIAQAENSLRMPPARRANQSAFSGNRSPLAWIPKGGSFFVVAKKGVTGPGITRTNRILFVLKRKVRIPAYTQSLPNFVDRFGDNLIKRLTT